MSQGSFKADTHGLVPPADHQASSLKSGLVWGLEIHYLGLGDGGVT